ncbi:MAG: asparagine synthase-related protein [Acidobacteriota bacterium]
MTSLCAALTEGPSPLAAMLINLAPPGSASGQHVNPEGVSLGYVHTPGGRNSGLFTDAASGWTWVGNARLDYRDELLLTLHLSPSLSDSALAFQALLRFETNCLQLLHGDWQFAAWNSRTRRLLVARDAFGSAGRYFHHSPGRCACSGHIDAVLACPGVPCRVNWDHLGLAVCALAHQTTDTGYQNIHRLAAGHALEATSHSCHVFRSWNVQEAVPSRRGSPEDLQLQFESTFRSAVESRVKTALKPAVTLSGGLDSGAVTAVAARALAATGQRLGAFTAVPAFPPTGRLDPSRILDEGTTAAAVAQLHPNIDHHLIHAAGRCPIAALHRFVSLTASPIANANAVWLLALMEEARAYGHHSLFNGQGGNATLSWQGPPSLRSRIKVSLLHFTRQSFRYRGAWRRFSLLRPSLVEAHQLAPLLFDAENTYRTRGDLRQFSLQAMSNASGFTWTSLAAAYDLSPRDPTVDPRFIRLCLSLPPRFFKDRQPARRATETLLPDVVRLSRRRGLQSADFQQRLAASLPAAYDVLDRFSQRPEIAGALDLPRLRKLLEHHASPSSPSRHGTASSQICCALAAGFFLERVAAAPNHLASRSSA